MKYILIITVLCLLPAASPAGENPSVERGRELFESPLLGTNGKSCASCHPGGKKWEWAATYDESRLAGIINECIKKPLKGKPLSVESEEMKSLVHYIRTFAGM